MKMNYFCIFLHCAEWRQHPCKQHSAVCTQCNVTYGETVCGLADTFEILHAKDKYHCFNNCFVFASRRARSRAQCGTCMMHMLWYIRIITEQHKQHSERNSHSTRSRLSSHTAIDVWSCVYVWTWNVPICLLLARSSWPLSFTITMINCWYCYCSF